jgi:CHAT domain-containing protein
MLTGDDAKRVAELENEGGQLFAAGKYAEARKAVQSIIELRTKVQGKDHWQTADARRLLQTVERFAALSDQTRAELAEAAKLAAEADALRRRGRSRDAIPLQKRSLEIVRRHLGEQEATTRKAVQNLAGMLRDSGQSAEAEPAYRKALSLCLEVLGEEHPDTALSYNNLAFNLDAQAKYAEAEPLYGKALAIYRLVLGEAHLNIAISSNNLAFNLEARRKYTEAEPFFRKVLTIYREVRGETHLDTARSYNNLAFNLNKQRKFAEAEPLFRKALAIYREVLGEAHPDTAHSYNSLANNVAAQGRYAEAEPLFRKTLAIRRQVLGEVHPDTAVSYNNVAFILDARGQHAEAEPLFRKALAIFCEVRGEAHPDTATGYNNVGHILNKQGKYGEAEPLLRKALALRQKVLGEAHPDTANSYNNLATNLDSQGRYAEAEPLHRKALGIRQKALGEAQPDTAVSYDRLADDLQLQGRYAEAEPLLRKALAMRQKALGEAHPDTAESYNSLAATLQKQGKYTEAESLSRRALAVRQKVLGEAHPSTGASYNIVALSLNAQGKYTEAEPLYRKALAIRQKALGEAHPATAQSYNNLAINLGDQGKYAEAEPLLRKALVIQQKARGETHAETANSYNNLAINLNAQGKHDEAELLFRKALAIRQKALGEMHPATAQSYNNLAFALNARGNYREAEKLWRVAADRYETARLAVGSTGLERTSFAAEQLNPLPYLAVCLARQDQAAEAWKFWEASLARGLFDDLEARLARPLSEKERRREQELTAAEQVVEKQIAALLRIKDLSDTQSQQLDRLHKHRDAILLDLIEFQAELARTHGPVAAQVYELVDIQKHLPADAALVGWLDFRAQPKVGDANWEHWACIVRQCGVPLWVQLRGTGEGGTWTKDDAELPARVQELFARQPSDTTVKWRELAGQLYRQRLAPLAQHLAASDGLPTVRHLIILPSWRLPGLPVEALVEARTDEQPAYTVSYAPSGTIFAWLQEKRKEALAKGKRGDAPRLLALGDPVFAPARETKPAFERLPGTRREVEAVARLFDKPDKLLGSEACEQQLEQLATTGRLQEYPFLHLATHGVMNPQIAMHSALILSQDNLPDPLHQVLAGKRAYDGRLTAAQILRTWKLDAELVTLSACQTGLGQYQGGEGYLGFAQALFVAGSRSLVLSQWEVDDRATALLMTRFYQNLLGKRKGLDKPMSKAEALRDAKEWLRGLTEKEVGQRLAELPRGEERERPLAVPGTVHPYAHPYYWAAFILIGDPN